MLHEDALAATADDHQPDDVVIAGRWANELGSTMTVEQSGSSLSGIYRSAVSGDGEPVSGPLVGWINGRQLAFTVRWPGGTVTAWVGHVVASGETRTLQTLWYLASVAEHPTDPAKFWDTILAGADQFLPAPDA